jgi:transcriptional regulator
MTDRVDLPQGTLELLILRTLALGPRHGWAISERIQQLSRDVLQVRQGSLYPALQRIERRGWVRTSWGTSDNNRRAKFYALTRKGRQRLEQESSDWHRLVAAIAQVLEAG